MQPLLTLDDLVVAASGRRLVDGVGLHVDAGERVALVGPSGAGKSLTVGAVLGRLGAAYDATARLRLGDRALDVARPTGRDGLAAVHQASAVALNPVVAVGTQLALVVRRRRRCGRAEARRSAVALLRAVDLDDAERLRRRCPGELSGGQRQRVCLALARASRPRLLLADVPTTALDTITRRRTVDTLDRLCAQHGTALLLVTHDVHVARDLCTRAVRLEAGRVVGEDAW